MLYQSIAKAAAKKVQRLVLSSGKVGVELTAEIGKRDASETAHLATARIEQLYPLPTKQLQEVLAAYENLKEVVWLQEEPQNQGPWAYIRPRLQALLPEGVRLRYIGRPEQAFVAESSPDVHNRVQADILQAALANDIN
ncbi:hypothetical protein GCM10025858_08380 [Alicyclobacillus sacchari]|nr:hypothetical protein GCM10025858_08380 [Alicyclobacillus sacchari]